MVQLEQKSKKRRKKENIQHAVLAAVGMAGVIAVAVVAPNVMQALPHLMGKQQYKLRFQTKTAIGRLIVKGYVKKNSGGYLEITESGRSHLALAQARLQRGVQAKRRWDKRYRLVVFDVPERRASVRNRLRSLMMEFGFLRLQNSVWVTPYDCEELVALIKAELRLGKDVLYVIADQIENDRWIRQHFNLKID